MATINSLNRGDVIKIKDRLFICMEHHHIKPGKGPAFVRLKIKGVGKQMIIEETFRPEEKVEVVSIERNRLQYLYKIDNKLIFLDSKNYSEYEKNEEDCKELMKFIIPGSEDASDLDALIYEDKIIEFNLPQSVNLKVTESKKGVKGNTVNSAMKQVTLETGYTVSVPLFINKDDIIQVSTKTGEYLNRIKKSTNKEL